MSDEIQAKADLPDDVSVSDPLDPENSTDSGTSELAEFEHEMLTMPEPEEGEETQGGEPAEPEPETEEAAEDESAEQEQESPEEELSETEEAEEVQAREQMRPRLKDPLDIAVASLAKARGISLIDAAKIIEGNAPAKSETPEEGSPPQVETSESIDAQLKELRAKHKEASTALEFEAAAEIFEQIEALRDKQVEVRFAEQQEKSRAEQRAAQEFDEKWDAAAQRAVTFYPESAKPDTALSKKIAELDQRMKELGDDLYFDPDKPFILAKEAARILKIPMRDPKAKPAVKSSTASPVQPASGNARTAPVSPAKRLNEELDALDSLDAFEAHVGAMSFG
jgi:hypothetical protein